MKKIELTDALRQSKSVIAGLIPTANTEANGLMPKTMAVFNATSSEWYEISGTGAFLIILTHPFSSFASIYWGFTNTESPESVSKFGEIFKGSQSSLSVKSKTTPSSNPKIYFKCLNYKWCKVVPLCGSISVKLTEDTVEE